MKGSRLLALAGAVGALALATRAPAQSTIYGQTIVSVDAYHRIVARVEIPGVTAANAKISGTKVETTAWVVGQQLDTTPEANKFVDMELVEGKLEIAGTKVAEPEGPSGPIVVSHAPFSEGDRSDGEEPVLLASIDPFGQGSPGTPGGGTPGGASTWQGYATPRSFHGVRFASTHFSDGTAVTCKVTGRIKSYKMVGGVKTLVDDRTVTAEIVPVCYNKLQTLGTGVNQSGSAQSWFSDASDKTHNAAKSALEPSHQTNPGTALQSRSQDKSQILDLVETSTVVSALTHGSLSDFSDSDLSELLFFDTDINSAVSLRNLPKYNLVAFWSCQTLIQGNEFFSDSVTAYDVAFHVARGYAGFNFSPAIRLWPGSSWTGSPPQPGGLQSNDLGDHATTFWNQILLGSTIEYALFVANQEYPPIVGGTMNPISTQPMVWVGDRRTNLINVYLKQSEYDALVAADKPTDIWWIKL